MSIHPMEKLEFLLDEYERSIIVESKDTKSSREINIDFGKFDQTYFFDGACTRKRGENGIGAWGVVAYSSKGEKLWERAGQVEIVGDITNNVSESMALLKVAENIKE